MSDQSPWTEAILKKRRTRAVITAWLLFAFAILLIFITIAQIGSNLTKRPPISLSSTLEKGVR